jgi:methyl-accepting chemotaxis protein
MTQQNAAMAEETSSVAATMKDQAKALTDLIAVFKVEGAATSSYSAPTASVTRIKRPSAPAAIAAPAPLKKAAGSDVDWQEF